ncbi:MAG TPA: penicillin-binding protein 2 [Thermoanaerobaculia bacterium]|nr:penicillin-binding protein 2 [Thermoanaerobaculia bacterium]
MWVREERAALVGRVRLLSRLTIGLLVALAAAFWVVQVVRGSTYRELADNNRLRRLTVRAPRGTIYDRAGRVLVENAPSYNLTLDRSETSDLAASLAFAAGALDRPVGELESALARAARQPHFAPVLLAEGLALDQVAHFEVARLEHPEFAVEVTHRRLYRLGAEGAHLFGYLGEITEEELAREPGRYVAGDWIGRRGIERAFDAQLRGQDGERVVVVDSRGQLVDEYRRELGRPGEPLTLTIDLELQRLAEELMAGQTGSVVALDPRNGEIRALVSHPSFDPNLFARRLRRDEWRELVEDTRHPLQNRAIQSVYSPGSVFKPIVALAALAEGVVREDERIHCAGTATYYGQRRRCWHRGGHGWVDLRTALKQSCDIYFYELGDRLGAARLARHARLFGLGRPTGLEIDGEKGGLVPDDEWSRRVRGHPWYPGETISVAIGQSALLTTPLQVAVAYAALANGGELVVPHLVRGERPPAPAKRLPIAPRHLAAVRDGLWQVVNAQGTGAAAFAAGLDIAGKTGTVQVVAQETWIDSATLPWEQRDHAWFASYAPAGDPRLVVVVFVEHGGKGSRAAAPVAKALHEKAHESEHGIVQPS